jgi:hypothetical protein
MKRKLIDFDAFQKIREESLTNVQTELEAAGPLLAHALGMDDLAVESFGDSEVLFESDEGDFVKATYDVKGGYVSFDNIEQLVLNEETEEKAGREVISQMLDALIESDEAKAEALFGEWTNMPRTHRLFSESKKGKRQNSSFARQRGKARRLNNRKTTSAEKKRRKSMRDKFKLSRNERVRPIRKSGKIVGYEKARKEPWFFRHPKKHMKEWAVIAENVLNFVDLQVNGPELDRVQTLRREGDVVAVKVPTIALRNEAKVLKFDWKTMNTDLVLKRRQSKSMHESEEFARSVADLKRLNALSDSAEFETKLEDAATRFPGVVYLTEGELARVVKLALEAVGATNFDDDTCAFISEGLLRTAHDAFADRISKIVRLAGGRLNERAEDKYAGFRAVADEFYSRLDESAELEMQAYVDVYESLRSVYELAREEGNLEVANETAGHLDDLLPMISGKADLDADALGDAAEWLYDVAEATQPEDWKTDAPHVTHDGEHPVLAGKAKKYQSPAEMQGSTPEYHHASAGKGADAGVASELGSDGFSNMGGEGVYPELDNPYVPKSEHPSIKGEKDVDADSGQLAHWGNDETWPNLSNPYSKASVTPKSVKE